MFQPKQYLKFRIGLIASILLLVVSYVFLFEIYAQTKWNKSIFYMIGSGSKSGDINFNTKLNRINNLSSKSYVRLQEEIVTKRSEHQKVVFYNVYNVGYGNRIYSMISAFMVAVLTDSALLIKWPYIDTYIDCILPNTFKSFQDESFLDYNKNTHEICNVTTKTKNSWIYEKRLTFLQSKSFIVFFSYYIQSIYFSFIFLTN